MESWLIFQHHDVFVCTMQGRRKVGTQGYGMSCERFQGWCLGKSGAMSSRFLTKSPDPTLPRKAAKERCLCPYRKPTQVVEERILRRLRELC